MSAAAQSNARVMRSYTRALRIGVLIGKMRDGTRIPGGPYTVTQAVTAMVIIVVSYVTRGLWSGLLPATGTISSELLSYPAILAFGAAGAWVAGKIPQEVNPATAMGGVISGTRPARFGTRSGRSIQATPPTRTYRARVLLPFDLDPAEDTGPSLREQLTTARAAARPSTPTTKPARAPRRRPTNDLAAALRASTVNK